MKTKTEAFAFAFVFEKNVRDTPSRSFATTVVEAAVTNRVDAINKTQVVNRVIAFDRIMQAV